MGIQGLWPLLDAKPVPNVLDYLKKKWIGIDVPMMLTVRWMRGETNVETLTEGFVQQYREWMQSENAPAAIIYVFDGTHGNPLKKAEHLRRNAARRQAQENIQAQRALLKLATSGDSTESTQTALVNTEISNSSARKLRDEHLCLVFDEVTNEPKMVLDVAGLQSDLTKRRAHQRFTAAEEAAAANTADDKVSTKSTPPAEVYLALMHAFENASIPYAISPDEAEHLLAAMNSRKEIDVMLTGDSDAIPFGGQVILRNFSPDGCGKNPNEVVIAEHFLAKRGLTRAQMVDVCIMTGCDFTVQRGLPGVGCKTAIKHILRYGTIENFLESPEGRIVQFTLQNKYVTTIRDSFDYQAARDIFLNDAIVPAQTNEAFNELFAAREALENENDAKRSRQS